MRYRQSVTDVGEDIMYEQLQFMLDICERPQLEEIESNSPVGAASASLTVATQTGYGPPVASIHEERVWQKIQ